MENDSTVSAIQLALGVSQDQSLKIFNDWQEHMGEVRSDLDYLSQSSVQEIRDYCQRFIKHDGTENLHAAAMQKRGVVFLSAHYACFYWMLFAKLSFVNEIVITRLDHDDRSRNIMSNLEKILPMRLPNVLADAHAVPRIYKALRQGNAAYAMFDFYSRSGPFVVCSLLGRDVAAPCALLSVAYRVNALIVPAFCFSSGPNRIIRTEKHIDPKDYDECDEETFIYNVATHMHELICEQIKQRPEQWQLWDNLRARWDFAETL